MIFVYLFIIGVPALLIFITIRKIVIVKAIEKHGLQTYAVVTDIRQVRSNRSWWDMLTMEYTDHKGKRHAAKATTVKGHYKPGNNMPLKYLNNKPSAYAIDGMRQGHWVMLIVFLMLLAFAIFVVYKIDALDQLGKFD